jgi:beta-lactamase superfamily II metal-dependent hydrolase
MPGLECRRPPLGRASLSKFAPLLAVLAGLVVVGCLRGPVPTNAFAQFYDQTAAEELPGQLVIYFLDTGQSDAIYVRAPSGQVMIIDTGDVETPGRVISFLAERKKVTRIEALVLSHPHADHIGDALAILNGLEVGAFRQSGYLHTTPAYQGILERVLELSKSGRSIYLEARAGDTLDLGPEVKVSVCFTRPAFSAPRPTRLRW